MGPALRAQPDRRLVDLVRDGYDAAFEEIVRRYRRPLDRFAAAIVGGRSEDVTQDAFSKALLALRGSEAEIELRPWLYRIVRNTALNDLRDRAPATDELLEEGLPGGLSTAAVAEAREELADLMERLRALPEPQRAAIVMRELEGLSHEEIAAALGVSGGAARQAIYRARAALRDGLGLLVPLPLLRALVEQADGANSAGGAIATGAGASSVGGAALSGLGGGAIKAGMATVLIAGAVGAGVAVEHHRGEGPVPQAAEAAPLVGGNGHRAGSRGTSAAGTDNSSNASSGGSHRGSGNAGGGHGGGEGTSSLGGGSGSGDGSSHSSEGSHHSGGSGSSGGSGPGPRSGSGSGDGDHQSGGSDSGGSTGSGSGGDLGGSLESDGGSDSGSDGGGSSGDGELSDPAAAPEPTLSDNGGDGGSSGSDSESSGSNSGDSGSGGSPSLDGSPISP